MESAIKEQLVDNAAKAPMLFVAASLGEQGQYNREPGIQLTKEQIISLRKYETLGLSLPVRYADVVAYLNYGAGDGGSRGLTAKEFLNTFSVTYDHAQRWTPLREKIMMTGTHLKIFAASIIANGKGIVQVYDQLKVSEYLEQHNIDTPEKYLALKQQIPDLPPADLAPGDVPDIKSYLNDMLTKVKGCHATAEVVRGQLDSFGTDMRVKVLPEIKLRLKFVSENTYQADVQVLQKEIDLRSAEIDELNKRYDQLVQEAIKSAATLNIGGLIMGIYQGVKAEQVRSQRKVLREAQEAAIQLMASKNHTLSSLNRVRGDLQNLSYVTIEAEVATQNLMLVWNALSLYIAASAADAENLDNAVSLRRFVNQIKRVVEPWDYIRDSADELLKIFSEADKEYEAGFTAQWGNTLMASEVSSSPQSDMNPVNLRALNTSVQEANIHAQMLFQQYGYLPSAVETMNRLAVSISGTSFEVRNVAQKNTVYFAPLDKTLRGYLSELGNPADADEVREDLEKELQAASKRLAEQAQDLKVTHAGLSARFDRTASAQWVTALEKDRAHAQQLKVLSEEKLAVLGEQMKTVSEAIDAIGKAGVEKIGEEAQLTLDNLAALGMAPPQVQAALLALEMLKKLIAGIGDAISYLNMLAGYERLKEKDSDLRTLVKSYTSQIGEFEGKIKLVNTLDTIDDARWDYVSEFANLVQSFERFAGDFEQDKTLSVEDRSNAALAQIPGIVSYLSMISR